ncbi:MAG: phenylacetate-CoA oxygenase subunit PaaC [Actinomycetota bacterium]|nr:phenylacetate-CoA oxygenase subunit PaaC [Actinomycetota bacterium]
MSATVTTAADTSVYALRLGDDALILAQQLGEWSSRAPELEEDIALTNIALDLLGQARFLLSRAGEIEGRGRSEDELAFGRDERDFLNCLLVEQPNGDFAQTIGRQLLFSTYQLALYGGLTSSVDQGLAGVAAKAVKEVAYHRDHAVKWTVRLGDGTLESHARMQRAIAQLWPYWHELFEPDPRVERLAGEGVAVDPAALRRQCDEFVAGTLQEATLAIPETSWQPSGGRRGEHTEGFGHMLAEMQWLHRSHPEASW